MMRKSCFTLLAAMFASCGVTSTESELKLRPMNEAESLADFEQMVRAVKDFYGPLEYKQDRFNFNFDELVSNTRQNILEIYTRRQEDPTLRQDDNDIYGAYSKFLATFQDGHVGIQFYDYNQQVSLYTLNLFITPLYDQEANEYRAYAAKLGELYQSAGIELWDELVSIDGIPTMDYLPKIQQYSNLGYEGGDRHFIFRAVERPFYMSSLRPQSNRAELVFRNNNNQERVVNAVWEVKTRRQQQHVQDGFIATNALQINEVAMNTIREMGAVDPFFISDEVRDTFNLQRVTASRELLEKHGFSEDDKIPEIYAGLYSYQGKRILLIRNRTYHHSKENEGFDNEDYMKHYRALLEQYESIADLLVIDQTNNGGGSYCESFYRLFITEEKSGFVQTNRADRRWIRTLNSWADAGLFGGATAVNEELRQSYLEMARQVEYAIDNGKSMTEHLPIISFNQARPDQGYNWKKPFLVLVNELAGSCADVFPMLVKRNQSGKLFGHRTMGLGGNVESVVELNVSGANVRLTRGLFTTYRADGNYQVDDYVENNGVTPDYEYKLTIEDVRSNFIPYFRAFSDQAIRLVE